MCSTTSSNENPTKIKFVHLEELWNFSIHLFSNWRHPLFENFDSSYEMLYFLIMIVETHWHDMQCTPWSRLCCHKNVGKKFLIWTSFEKYKQLWSYDYMNQIIKLLGPWTSQEHIPIWAPTGGAHNSVIPCPPYESAVSLNPMYLGSQISL
jgi:hypothetical protein